MKKIYNAPSAELVSVISEKVLATSIPGDSGGFTDIYDTAGNRRPWGNLWAESYGSEERG